MRSTPVEFNTILALRPHDHFLKHIRAKEECLPAKLEVTCRYRFDKKGQRIYPVGHETFLYQTNGEGGLEKKPVAYVRLNEATHYDKGDDDPRRKGEIWTKGTYTVQEKIDPTDEDLLLDLATTFLTG